MLPAIGTVLEPGSVELQSCASGLRLDWRTLATYPKPPYQNGNNPWLQRRAAEGLCQCVLTHGSALFCRCGQVFEMDGPWDPAQFKDILCSSCGIDPELEYRDVCPDCSEALDISPDRARAENIKKLRRKRAKAKGQRARRGKHTKVGRCGECGQDCPRIGSLCFYRYFAEGLRGTFKDAPSLIARNPRAEQWIEQQLLTNPNSKRDAENFWILYLVAAVRQHNAFYEPKFRQAPIKHIPPRPKVGTKHGFSSQYIAQFIKWQHGMKMLREYFASLPPRTPDDYEPWEYPEF